VLNISWKNNDQHMTRLTFLGEQRSQTAATDCTIAQSATATHLPTSALCSPLCETSDMNGQLQRREKAHTKRALVI
jgi:hypothetical protein